MPRRELKNGKQVAAWLDHLSRSIFEPGNLILIESGALLWHAHDRGISTELPEASMDVDRNGQRRHSETLLRRMMGSEFEKENGWHVHLMPDTVLTELPAGWRTRALVRTMGLLTLIVPEPKDLMAPKLKRKEPRDP